MASAVYFETSVHHSASSLFSYLLLPSSFSYHDFFFFFVILTQQSTSCLAVYAEIWGTHTQALGLCSCCHADKQQEQDYGQKLLSHGAQESVKSDCFGRFKMGSCEVTGILNMNRLKNCCSTVCCVPWINHNFKPQSLL